MPQLFQVHHQSQEIVWEKNHLGCDFTAHNIRYQKVAGGFWGMGKVKGLSLMITSLYQKDQKCCTMGKGKVKGLMITSSIRNAAELLSACLPRLRYTSRVIHAWERLKG